MLKRVALSIAITTAMQASEPTPTKKPINPVVTELAAAIPDAPIDVLSLVAEYAAPQTINVTDAVKEFIEKNPSLNLPMPPELSIAGFLPEAVHMIDGKAHPLSDKDHKMNYNSSKPNSYRYGIKVKVLVDLSQRSIGSYTGPHKRFLSNGPYVLFIYNPTNDTLEVQSASATTTIPSSGSRSRQYHNWEVQFPYNRPPAATIPPFDYTFPNGLRLQAKKIGNDTFEWSAQMQPAAKK